MLPMQKLIEVRGLSLFIYGVLDYKEYAIHQNPCSDLFKICYFIMAYPVEEVSYPRHSLVLGVMAPCFVYGTY